MCHIRIFITLIALSMLISVPLSYAQEVTDKAAMDNQDKGAMDLQEKQEKADQDKSEADAKGNDKGKQGVSGFFGRVLEFAVEKGVDNQAKIDRIDVVERYGNSVTISAYYKGVINHENVRVKGVALRGGRPLSAIESTIGTVDKANGRASLTLSWADAQYGSEIKSDQVEILLYRGDESPFKARVFDLKKNWTSFTEAEEYGGDELVFDEQPSGSDAVGAGTGSAVTSTESGGTYGYIARTASPVRKTGQVMAGGLTWYCEAQRCTIRGPWPIPGVSSCNALAKEVGRMTSYGHSGKILTSTQLNQCNSGVSTGVAGVIVQSGTSMQQGDGTPVRVQVQRTGSGTSMQQGDGTPVRVVVQPAPVSGHYYYTARTFSPLNKSGQVMAGGLKWGCANKACTINGPWPTPGVSACNKLAKEVGRIASYGHTGKMLTSAQLSQCNAGISSAPPARGLPPGNINMPTNLFK